MDPTPRPSGPALVVTCRGTRGSVPSPGAATLRYGGNTSCVEVRAAPGRRYVFDAGTGLRAVGRGEAVEADLFVTHTHWDHIQGFPFWTAPREPGSRVCVHGPRQDGMGVRRVLEGQMSAPYFPVRLGELFGEMEFADVGEAPWSDGEVEVAACRVRHGGLTYGYRVRAGGVTFAYVPDNELGEETGSGWYRGLVDFLAGADLLFHDAMVDEAEAARFGPRGHSTFRQAVRLAEDAGVAHLRLFHHHPDRADDALDRIAGELREALAARGSGLVLGVAAEGEEIALGSA